MIFIVFSLIIFAFGFWATRNQRKEKNYSSDLMSSRSAWRFVFLLPFMAVLIFSIAYTAIAINSSNNVKNSMFIVEELTDQRDQLLETFDEVLANEDFVQLMEASVPEDIKFLRNNPKVSDFLLGRADRIVAVNQRLFSERNVILEESRDICNYVDNPLTFQLPLLVPDCELGTVMDITNYEKE
jgi:hypothetical protein